MDLTFSPVEWHGESFTPPVYFGYRLGWILPFAARVAIEAEFIHLKVYAETRAVVTARGHVGGMPVNRSQRLDATVQSFSISHGANFVLVNVAYRQPLSLAFTDRVVLVARAGIGPTMPHAESTIGGVTDPGEYALGSLGWQVAGGVELRLVRGLRALGEYKFSRTRQTVRVPDGEARTLLRTHHIAFGLGYRF
jgi:opacity protein-like surface antigen